MCKKILGININIKILIVINNQLFSITSLLHTCSAHLRSPGKEGSGLDPVPCARRAKLCSSCVLWTPWSGLQGHGHFPLVIWFLHRFFGQEAKSSQRREDNITDQVCVIRTHTHTPLTDLQPHWHKFLSCYFCVVKRVCSSFKDWIRLYKETKSVLLSTHRRRKVSLSTL